MKCSVCGSENLEGSAYCEDCGARLQAGVAAPTQEAPAVAAPPPPPPVMPEPAPAVVAPAPVVEAAPAPGGTVRCSACGADNPSYEAYCEDCGASLTAARADLSVPAAAPAPVAIAPPAPVAARPRLVLADGAQEFPVDKDEVALGRRSPADGIFPGVDLTEADTESYVSRRHGRLVRQDQRFLYEDVGSSNGSFVNGTKLQPGVQVEIHEGDRLRLGKTEMVFRA